MLVRTTLAIICILGVKFNSIFRKKLREVTKLNISYYLKLLGGAEAAKWRRKWQPTPVFLPGESQGRWSLVGCRLWGCTESDMTEVT